jgi:diguanylate cyclase (GGDEF)-like protein
LIPKQLLFAQEARAAILKSVDVPVKVIKLHTAEAKLGSVDSTVRGIETSRAHRLRADDAGHADAPTSVAELRRTLAATELRFAAALRQLERMRRREALRKREAASLTEAVAKAQRFAYHDELTGLPNRRSLLDHFELATALAARHEQHVALLFIDLDRFKHVNDSFGHAVGDELLRQVAVRLLASVRASDTVCRYGGDEFAVLLPELSGKDGAAVVADSIRAQLAAPYAIDGVEISVTISLGIAMHPIDADDYGDLLQLADHAMYRDKARTTDQPMRATAPT